MKHAHVVSFAMLAVLGMGTWPTVAEAQEDGDVHSEFRVLPYLLHPAADGVTVIPARISGGGPSNSSRTPARRGR